VIVLGIDAHTQSHTAAALDAASGELVAELTVEATDAGGEELLAWARALDGERLFALEDCRALTGRLERLLLTAGEPCLRVPTRLAARSRRRSRRRGKSDAIDAACVARAALAEPDLPRATLPGPEEDLRLLAAHRSDLVAERTRTQQRLRWHLVALELPLKVPPRRLSRKCWLARLEEALADRDGTRAEIARVLLSRCRELNREIDRLERELDRLTLALAPGLRALPGCGAVSAATLVGETAGAARFATAARFAMHAGTAPLPASSGRVRRHRLNRGGNRRLNAALHRMALTQLQKGGPGRAYVERRMSEGKSWLEAMRCLKRHLARVVWRELRRDEERRAEGAITAAAVRELT
jgi:transposase